MSDSQVKINLGEHAGTIILDRPDKRNALSRKLIADIGQALFDLHHERQVRAVILTGRGVAFCAGMDLDEIHQTREQNDSQRQWYEDTVAYRDLLQTMLQFPKPIIAAVNGPAVAGGVGLVLASDIVVAAPHAKLGFPEPRRGLVAGMVSPLLVFRAGAGHAANWLLTARMFDVEEALRIGVYHEVVQEDLVWARAAELAAECAQSSSEALQLTKKVLNESVGEHLTTLLSAGAAASATARTTEAAAEGIAAFLEKRPPQWP